MKIIKKLLSRFATITLTLALLLSVVPVDTVSAATSAQIKEAQSIVNKFGMQAGPVDGIFGPLTARGFCMFRSISGLTPSRAGLDTALLTKLRSFNAKYASLRNIPSSSLLGSRTYLVVSETCQMMAYSLNGYYRAFTPISSGQSGFGTPNGTWRIGYTKRGWSCSTLYPETCKTQTAGRFAYISNYGNMYNKRTITGAVLLHGSTSVPTYPASHGCVRVPIAFSDWMYDYVDANIPIQVTGAY